MKNKNEINMNIKYPLLDLNKEQSNSANKKKHEMKWIKFIRRYLALIRYLFMTHKKARFGSRVTYIFICLIVIFDSVKKILLKI